MNEGVIMNDLGWILNERELEEKRENFNSKTGFPHSLLFLFNSTFFPMGAGRPIFRRFSSLSVPVVGLFYIYGIIVGVFFGLVNG